MSPRTSATLHLDVSRGRLVDNDGAFGPHADHDAPEHLHARGIVVSIVLWGAHNIRIDVPPGRTRVVALQGRKLLSEALDSTPLPKRGLRPAKGSAHH